MVVSGGPTSPPASPTLWHWVQLASLLVSKIALPALASPLIVASSAILGRVLPVLSLKTCSCGAAAGAGSAAAEVRAVAGSGASSVAVTAFAGRGASMFRRHFSLAVASGLLDFCRV